MLSARNRSTSRSTASTVWGRHATLLDGRHFGGVTVLSPEHDALLFELKASVFF
jgi:hypothetical protein